MSNWVRVELPYACFGLRVRDGIVTEAAPIARWAIGLPESQVARYFARKGAVFCRLNLSTGTPGSSR
jgi:hypothetical protein